MLNRSASKRKGQQQKEHAMASNKSKSHKETRGRKRIGLGAQPISLTVEKGLLARANKYCDQQGITRAALVAQALTRILPKTAKK